jgi:hypothetical protein
MAQRTIDVGGEIAEAYNNIGAAILRDGAMARCDPAARKGGSPDAW